MSFISFLYTLNLYNHIKSTQPKCQGPALSTIFVLSIFNVPLFVLCFVCHELLCSSLLASLYHALLFSPHLVHICVSVFTWSMLLLCVCLVHCAFVFPGPVLLCHLWVLCCWNPLPYCWTCWTESAIISELCSSVLPLRPPPAPAWNNPFLYYSCNLWLSATCVTWPLQHCQLSLPYQIVVCSHPYMLINPP